MPKHTIRPHSLCCAILTALVCCSCWPALQAQGAAKLDGHTQPEKPRMVPTDRFSVPEGLEVTVWATTPLLYNPTNIDFDATGRLWVAEGVNYRGHSKRRPEGDRIVVLEDTDGDGKADSSHVFVQEPSLIAPLGVAVFEDKVVVSQPPDLLVYTDVNHDGKFDPAVDKREVLLTGFNGQNHDHSLHSVTAGPDGLWYFNQGNTGAKFTDKSGKTFQIGSPYFGSKSVFDPTTIAGQKSDDDHVWIGGFMARMQPDGTSVAIIGHNFRNSFEQTVNSLGDIYQSDNDAPPACRVTPVLEYGNAGFVSRDGKRDWQADRRPGQDVPTAEWRQEDPGTMPAGDVYGGGAPTGVAFYENGALDKKWRGLLLACEAGRNTIFGYLPKPDGAGFKMERFDFLTSNKEKKFSGSDFLGRNQIVSHELKTLFRPSDVVVGPDGALYVADWFDARVGGHADLDEGTMGSIYRIAPKGFKPKVPRLDLSSIEGQVAALKSPAVNVRWSGFTRLKAQGEATIPQVAALLDDENPYIAARAVWLLAQMGEKGVAKVTPLLQSNDEVTRLIAFRALRRAGQRVLKMAAQMANDRSAAVRREVALSLRDVPFEQSGDLLLQLAKGYDGKDRTYLEAFGTGCMGKERQVYADLRQSLGHDLEHWSDAFARLAWRLGSPDAVPDFKARALSIKLTPAQRKLMLDGLAFVKSPFAALAMVDLASAKDFPFQAEAKWWLFNRQGNEWSNYGIAGAMKERGLYDPDSLVLTSAISPAPAETPPILPELASILALKGDVARGKTAIAACYICHQIGQQGIDFGPDLTAFGKTQTREVILNAIVYPSADISHGYEATHLQAKGDVVIDGIVLATGDPVMIKSIGGQIQSVPRNRIQSMKPLGRSLMFSAETLGLNAQSLADIVAYLQSDLINGPHNPNR